MALPILDGNQTATTLSTIVTGGAHIPAHTVVSLGSQAITDMRGAVSGSVVSISNFPATQTVAGTVTANVVGKYNVAANIFTDKNILTDSTGQTLINASVNGQSVFSYDGQAHIFARLTPSSSVTIGSLPAISGTVTVGNTVTITGTVTANPTGTQTIAGTVTLASQFENPDGKYLTNSALHILSSGNWEPVELGVSSLPISGTVTANVSPDSFGGGIASDQGGIEPNFGVQLGYYDGEYKTVRPSQPLPISGTVTANNPSGALTTRFGSVTTANTAQLTSAVTNTSRKYLLVQNIATSTVTIGIGFAPTTTQGIQLTAGAGLTFDAFCPTGGVWWLSSTTGSNFSILEG
jgi:hypothetical protein